MYNAMDNYKALIAFSKAQSAFLEGDIIEGLGGLASGISLSPNLINADAVKLLKNRVEKLKEEI
jgi:hypothetical protein